MMVVSYPRGVYSETELLPLLFRMINSLVPFEPCSVSFVGNSAVR